MPSLQQALDDLVARTDLAARLAHDPISYPRRYADPRDQEVAALYAALLAFGKVDLFRRTLDPWFAWMDARGGPFLATRDLTDGPLPDIEGLGYRWMRGEDFVHWMRATQRVLRQHGGLEPLFDTPGGLKARISHASEALRSACPPRRSLSHLFADPAGGSACKRWHLFLRWMVRPPTDGVDLGIWSTLAPSDLLMPVDTHVLRIARFLGLTERNDASWRTAECITASLALFDPADPIRYDFAIAQLGISGGCLGYREATVCARCAIEPWCVA